MVACSTTFEGKRRLCSAPSEFWKPVSESFPWSFRRARGKQNGQQYKFPIFNTSVDTLLYKCKHSYTTTVYVSYKHTYILTYIPTYHWKHNTSHTIKCQYKNYNYRGCLKQPLIIKLFYKHCKGVGMALKEQKQGKANTQWSINHGPYMQECHTALLSNILECRDDG